MPTREYYQKNREKCQKQNHKDLKKFRISNPPTIMDREKNKENAAKWLDKIENRIKKNLYLQEYNKRKTKGQKKGRGESCLICEINILQVLDVHHVIPRSLGGSNKPDNKITVCANCHRLIHAGLLKLLP